MKAASRYAYVILACLMLIGVVFTGLNTTVSGLYVIPITADLGFTRAAYSSVVSIGNLSYAVMCLFFGLFQKKIGLKRMLAIGGLLHAVAIILLSFARTLGVFYGLSVIRGLTTAFCGGLMIPVLVNKWFSKGNGMLISAVYVVSTLGGLVFCSLVARWIDDCGWDGTYRITGYIMAASTLLLLLLVRESPSTALPANCDVQETPPDRTGISLREALRKPFFYLFFAVVVLIGAVIYVMMLLLPSIMGGKGFSIEDQALFNNVMLLSCVAVKLPLGALSDKKGVVLEILICFACEAIGLLLLRFFSGRAVMYLASALLGVGIVTLTATTPILVIQYFGLKDYGSVCGLFMSAATAGFAVCNPVFNGIFDRTGSYDGAYLLSLALLAVMTVLLLVGAKIAARDRIAA